VNRYSDLLREWAPNDSATLKRRKAELLDIHKEERKRFEIEHLEMEQANLLKS